MSDVYGYVESERNALNDLEEGITRGDTPGAMRAIAYLNDRCAHIATELVELGVREGMTQARMADCLDVPASALRGARRELRDRAL